MNEICEVLLHFFGGAPGQNPVEREYTMACNPRVNQLDGDLLDKVENYLFGRQRGDWLGAAAMGRLLSVIKI